MRPEELTPQVIVRGPIFPKPVQVITTTVMGNAIKLIGKALPGVKVGRHWRFHRGAVDAWLMEHPTAACPGLRRAVSFSAKAQSGP